MFLWRQASRARTRRAIYCSGFLALLVSFLPITGPAAPSAKVIMSSRLRIILLSIGTFIFVLLILPFLIPVNQFRPSLEEKASAALGRKVVVGNLRLSLFSGSLAAEDLTIGD